MKTKKNVIVGLSILLFLAVTAGFGQFMGERSLTYSRNGHTATWIPSHCWILIAGGEYSSTVWQTVELHSYTGGIIYAGPMTSPRAFHAAVLLPDGGVLITGGKDSRGNTLNSAEIFDSNSRIFRTTNPMMKARSGHTATALADGRILIVGGDAEGTIELFDPLSRTFTLSMGLEVPRRLHSAIRLDSGQILIVGGTDMNGAPLLSAEIVDLSAPTSIPVHNDLSEARIQPDLRLLPDGKVQVIGGNEHETFEMYDPEGRSFKASVHIVPPGFNVMDLLWSGTRAALLHNHQTPGSLYPPFDRLFDRSGHRLTEIDCPIPLIFVSGGVDSSGQALNSAFWLQNHSASVTTNLTDYVQGEAVIISGQGWPQGVPVDLDIFCVASGEPFHCEAIADASGNFASSDFLTGEPGSSYLLTAGSSFCGFRAQTSFQVSPILLSVGILLPASTFPGGSATYSFDICRWDPSDEPIDVDLTILAPPDGPSLPPDTSFMFDPPVVHFEPGPSCAGVTLVLSTSPSTPPDEYVFAIKAFRIDDPCIHAVGAGNLSVEPQFPPLAIIMDPDCATRTVGESVTFSVGAQGPEPLTYQWYKRPGPIPGATADSYTIPFVTASDAGQYYVKVSSPDGSVLDSRLADLTVNRAFPDIFWPFPEIIRSGVPLDTGVFTAEASFMGTPLIGSFVYDPPAGTIMPPGPFVVEAVFTPENQDDYESCTVTAQIDAQPVPPDISWPSPDNINYGTPLSPTQLNATAAFNGQVVVGDFQYDPAEGEVLDAGDQVLSVYFTPTEAEVYLPVSGTTLLKVNKVEPALIWSNPEDIASGVPLGETQLNATASVPGTFVYDPAAGTILAPGSRPLFVTFTPTDTDNYLVVTGQVMINVTQATVTLSWDNPAEIIYGTPLSNIQLDATADVPGTFAYDPPAGTILDAGLGQTLHVAFTPDDQVIYPGASMDVTIDVSPALLTVKAADASKAYGADLPDFTADYTGFVPNQGPNDLGGGLVLLTTAEAGSPVGTYPITPSGLTSTNYSISYEEGTLTVSRVPLTVKADDTWMILAGALPAFNATFDGFVLNEGPEVLGGELVFNTTATQASPIGAYPVTPTGLTSTDYEITWLDGVLRVGYADAGACAGGHIILPPIKADGTSVFKRGSTVPAKFRVFDANCASIGTPGVVSAFRLVQIIAGTSSDVDLEVSSTTPDTAFRWSADDQLWIFNISTKGLDANQTYVYQITLNDGTEILFQFGLK
jgi:hypothetical protein